jgi:hypothetical protein
MLRIICLCLDLLSQIKQLPVQITENVLTDLLTRVTRYYHTEHRHSVWLADEGASEIVRCASKRLKCLAVSF